MEKKKGGFISANQIIEISILNHQSISHYLYFQRSKFTSLDYSKYMLFELTFVFCKGNRLVKAT